MNKRFSIPLLILLLMSTFRGYGQIDISTGVYNTSGAQIPVTYYDDTWSVSYPGSGGFIGVQCGSGSLYYPGTQTVNAYACQPTGVRWLFPFMNSSGQAVEILNGSNPPLGDYQYQANINITTCYNIKAARIVFSAISADNNITDIKVNNVAMPFNTSVDFQTCYTPPTINIPNAGSLLQIGQNTITVTVKNASTFTGFVLKAKLEIDYDYYSLYPIITSYNSMCANNAVVSGYQTSGVIQKYYWSYEQCDQYGNTNGGYGYTQANNPASGPSVADMNMKTVSPTYPCNSYYKVTLAVWNQCVGWKYTSKVVYIKCSPTFTMGRSSKSVCVGTPGSLLVTMTSGGNYTMTIWNLNNNTNVYSGPVNVAVSISPTVNTTYKITVTDQNTGCSEVVNWPVSVIKCKRNIDPVPHPIKGNYYGITAFVADGGEDGEPGFGYAWFLEEIGETTGETVFNIADPGCWHTPDPEAANTFKGVDVSSNSYSGNIVSIPCTADEGVFESGHTYRITRATWSDQTDYDQYSVLLSPVYGKGGASGFTVIPNVNAPDMSGLLTGRKQSSIAARAVETMFSVYPNPGTGVFVLKANSAFTGSIEVYDLVGKKVYELAANDAQEYKIDLTDLPKGMYFINMSSAGKTFTQKVIKQ